VPPRATILPRLAEALRQVHDWRAFKKGEFMKWTRILCLVALMAPSVPADELHLRDGTVIVGSYIGGSQKEIWFQRMPAAADVFPLFMVESLKFNSAPTLAPGTAAGSAAAANLQARLNSWTGRVEWAFALFFPPPLTAQLAHPAH